MATTSPVSAGFAFQQSGASSRARMTQDQFLKMLIGQLQNQDPMEPMDNGQFLDQVMQMQQLQTSASLSDGISGLLKFQTLATASGMIGKTVQGIGEDGRNVNGVVEKVTMDSGDVRLIVGGVPMQLGNVTTVVAAPTA